MSSAPPAKRSRTDIDTENTNATDAAAINSPNNKVTNTNNNTSIEDNNNDVISTSKILQQITTLTNDYRIATPFPHGIINNFCTDGLLGEFVCCFYIVAETCYFSIVHKLLQCIPKHNISYILALFHI